MIITRLQLQHFRNHTQTDISWAPGVNIITGVNGAGKTNLLDAVHYLCMSRSFVASTDQYVVTSGEKSFSVTGDFEGSIRSAFQIRCSYARGDGKHIFVNDSPLDKLSDLIGRVPVVVLSPDDKKLTSEGPAERRSFLDGFIAQLSPAYLRDLLDYRRIVKQRNAVLSDTRMSAAMQQTMLEPWNDQLVRTGSRIIARRAITLRKFAHFLEESYALIAGIGHRPHFVYNTICDVSADGDSLATVISDAANSSASDAQTAHGLHSVENLAAQVSICFESLVSQAFPKERERQQTTVGPHRDDVIFYLDSRELRKFGSQGQHRLFALALKMAQRAYYADVLEDLPILLLDDVFGDLDPRKTRILMEMLLSHEGQTFITAANRALFDQFVVHEDGKNHYYEVENGTIASTWQPSNPNPSPTR